MNASIGFVLNRCCFIHFPSSPLFFGLEYENMTQNQILPKSSDSCLHIDWFIPCSHSFYQFLDPSNHTSIEMTNFQQQTKSNRLKLILELIKIWRIRLYQKCAFKWMKTLKWIFRFIFISFNKSTYNQKQKKRTQRDSICDANFDYIRFKAILPHRLFLLLHKNSVVNINFGRICVVSG